MAGSTIKSIAQATRIDRWFIYQIQIICNMEKDMMQYTLDTIPTDLLKEAKKNGFGDRRSPASCRDIGQMKMYMKSAKP
jgi:carbamoyl-phosphate synthase large subunit